MLLNHDIENLQDLVYVSGVDMLKGYSNPRGIFIGTWKKRNDISEILIQLRVSINDPDKEKIIKKLLNQVYDSNHSHSNRS